MKIFKNILSVILCIAFLASIFLSVENNKTQNLSGESSSICTVTPLCEEWILENFSNYETVEEVMVAYDNFACKNYTYEKRFYLQNFDFEGFITTKNYHGVCFEFTCTLKCVLLVLSKHYDRFSEVKSYVCSVKQSNGERHCYNIVFSGKCYKIDITSDVTRYQVHKKLPVYYTDCTGASIEEIAKASGDSVFLLL